MIWYPTLKEGNKEFVTLLNENKYGSLLHVPTIYILNCMSFIINLPRESKEWFLPVLLKVWSAEYDEDA